MDTEPVPAPISQQTASPVSASAEMATERISRLVMGTARPSLCLPRTKALSGSPWVTTAPPSCSTSTALREWKCSLASSAALPQRIRSPL